MKLDSMSFFRIVSLLQIVLFIFGCSSTDSVSKYMTLPQDSSGTVEVQSSCSPYIFINAIGVGKVSKKGFLSDITTGNNTITTCPGGALCSSASLTIQPGDYAKLIYDCDAQKLTILSTAKNYKIFESNNTHNEAENKCLLIGFKKNSSSLSDCIRINSEKYKENK